MPMFNGFGAGWPSETVKKVLRLLGDATPLQQLAPELQTEISLESDPVEWWALKQKYLWNLTPQLATASVGNLSMIGVHNPPNSGQLVVVLGARIQTLAAGVADISFCGDAGSVFAGGYGSSCQYTDLRLGSITGNSAVGPPRSININTLAGVARNVIDEFGVGLVVREPWFIALAPSWSCVLVSQTANQAIRGSMWGYVRALTPEELQLGAR